MEEMHDRIYAMLIALRRQQRELQNKRAGKHTREIYTTYLETSGWGQKIEGGKEKKRGKERDEQMHFAFCDKLGLLKKQKKGRGKEWRKYILLLR